MYTLGMEPGSERLIKTLLLKGEMQVKCYQNKKGISLLFSVMVLTASTDDETVVGFSCVASLFQKAMQIILSSRTITRDLQEEENIVEVRRVFISPCCLLIRFVAWY